MKPVAKPAGLRKKEGTKKREKIPRLDFFCFLENVREIFLSKKHLFFEEAM